MDTIFVTHVLPSAADLTVGDTKLSLLTTSTQHAMNIISMLKQAYSDVFNLSSSLFQSFHVRATASISSDIKLILVEANNEQAWNTIYMPT